MVKTRIITLGGGFHNSSPINIKANIPDKIINAGYKVMVTDLIDYLSENQIKKIDRHFCGIKKCMCGSYLRAEILNIK